MINKHEAVRDWVQQFLDDRYLYFENIELYPGMRSIVPSYGDSVIKTDIIGRKYKRYVFAFVGIEDISQDTNDQNTANMQLFDDFNAWVEEQDKLRNYPYLGYGTSGYHIKPLQNMANMAMTSEDGTQAKYMLMIQIDYVEESEE